MLLIYLFSGEVSDEVKKFQSRFCCWFWITSSKLIYCIGLLNWTCLSLHALHLSLQVMEVWLQVQGIIRNWPWCASIHPPTFKRI